VIAADRAPVRRFRHRCCTGASRPSRVRIVRPDDTAIRQIRIFAEPVLAGDEVWHCAARSRMSDALPHQVALAATQDQLADSEQRAEQEQELALRLQPPSCPRTSRRWRPPGGGGRRYRPASRGAWWRGLVRRAAAAGQATLLVVGDITGHGIDAVTGMIAARNALRGARRDGRGPADLLRHLNFAACHLTEGIAVPSSAPL